MNKNRINTGCKLKNQFGVTLIELMIALTIGAVLLVGLATVFMNSSSSRKELEKAAALVENGRYAISIITEDLALAGFYGFHHDIGTVPVAMPDPCVLTAGGLANTVGQPLQGYRAADKDTKPVINTVHTCGALLPTANLTAGSDFLILRRADTAVAGAMTAKIPYIEANSRDSAILIDTAATGLERSPNKAGSPAADIREYHVRVYFIAPCSRGSGANGICQGGDDDIPTLKRLELGSDGTNTAMQIEPLVEGIEYMKIQYGIDTNPAAINGLTGQIGDGIPDSYINSPLSTQWDDVVSVQVYLLARSPDQTTGYTDSKAYTLGSTAIPAPSDSYKRHVYSAEVRPTNVAGRREIPE